MNQEIEVLKEINKSIYEDNTSLKEDLNTCKSFLTDENYQAIDMQTHLKQLARISLEEERKLLELVNNLSESQSIYKKLQKEIVVLEDEILFQDFGLYTPTYNFASIDMYKNKLKDIRNSQKLMIKENTAAIFSNNWTVDGCFKKGAKMTKNNVQQIIRTFNTESETIINNLKFSNYESMINRMDKSFNSLNKLNEVNLIYLNPQYLELKKQELDISMEFQTKKEFFKEEQRIIREEKIETEKLKAEIKEKKDKIKKEKTHYSKALNDLKKQIETERDKNKLLDFKLKEMQLINNLNDLDVAIKDVDYRAANQRAGYVYIVSNIGSLGENIYKIGMTRRLNPEDRIKELSGASVPFVFDVHALIFSDDAPSLENALHKAFEHRKVNLVNGRKEFFNVTLNEIEQEVRNNFDKTVEFNRIPEAEQYRETLMIRRNDHRTSN